MRFIAPTLARLVIRRAPTASIVPHPRPTFFTATRRTYRRPASDPPRNETEAQVSQNHGHPIQRSTSEPQSRVYQYKYNEKTAQGSFEWQDSPDDERHVSMTAAEQPAAWAELMDCFLPKHLRSHGSSKGTIEITSREQLKYVFTVLRSARDSAEDLILWMILNNRKKAAIYLVEIILRNITTTKPSVPDRPPSNIDWHSDLLQSLCQEPIEIESLSYSAPSEIESALDNFDDELLHRSGKSNQFLGHVWISLGRLVIEAADQSAATGSEMLNSVQLILGKMHNLGMMPDNVYAYASQSLTSNLQRPPILHLLSSRILTSLSDAVWRDQQDDIIHQAAATGIAYREIGQNPPGGRFRLKVRPLGPEIWLELILWCCIESGFTSSAVTIIQMLKAKSDQPWFAIRWNSTDSMSPIDWARVKSRHGGAVGLIEGYSRERPLVEVPARTISLEVVMALVDSLMNKISPGNTELRFFSSMGATQRDIVSVIEFLEPHDLPTGYFDYVTVRLIQSDGFDMERAPSSFKRWCESVTALKDLETLRLKTRPAAKLELNSIIEQSELHPGIYHQAMDGLVQVGDFHQALEIFNVIQKLVDQSKLSAIQAFLQEPVPSSEGFFSSRPFQSRLEFVGSHGQLPYYKLGGLLNLISDTNMVGLGRWLLYADDVDGPLIPAWAYGRSGLFTPLIRFAAVSQDEELLNRVLHARSKSHLLLSVRAMRSLVNCYIDHLDFSGAAQQLLRLRSAQAGGQHFDNIAHIGATILRLEGRLFQIDDQQQRAFENGAFGLLESVLSGRYDSTRADFTRTQKIVFGQQITSLLRIFHKCEGSQLQDFARRYVSEFPSGNAAHLPASSFNVMLSAILDTRGAEAGIEMWNAFCQLPGEEEQSSEFLIEGDQLMTRRELTSFSHDADSPPSVHSINAGTESSRKLTNGTDRKSGNGNFLPFDLPNEALDDEDMLELFERQAGFFNPDNVRDQDPAMFEGGPITVPDLRTLRLIVRAAVDAKSRLETRELAAQSQQEVLKWSVRILRDFFNAPLSLIQQEIQQPLTETDLVQFSEPEMAKDYPSIPKQLTSRIRIPKIRNTRVRDKFDGRPHTRYPNEWKIRAV